MSSSSCCAWRSFSCRIRAAIAPPDLCLLERCRTAACLTGAGLNASIKFMHKATSCARKGARCLSFIKSTSRTPQATLLRNHVSASSNLLHWAWQHAKLKAQSALSSETSLLPSVFASNLRALSKHSVASFHSSSSTWAMPCSQISSNSLVSCAFFSSPLSFGFGSGSGLLGAKSSSESAGAGFDGAKSSSESDIGKRLTPPRRREARASRCCFCEAKRTRSGAARLAPVCDEALLRCAACCTLSARLNRPRARLARY
mmetsp:Transcript_20252/g.53117  ORF Transcript_20252/g.53117 Transcript_20252/m.53117 type:complete len:258 (-) Transcript_20252:21-794(-)